MPEVAVEVVVRIVGAAEIVEEAGVPTTTIIIEVKTKIKIRVPRIIQTNRIRKDQNIQIYLPVLGGPVLSTGRKAEALLIVATHLSVSGSRSWPHASLNNLPLQIE